MVSSIKLSIFYEFIKDIISYQKNINHINLRQLLLTQINTLY